MFSPICKCYDTYMNAILFALVFSVGINILMFIPAFIKKTDKLTDISYALTFIALGLFNFAQSDASFAKLIMLAAILLWAGRLGGFLLIRIRRTKTDKRFDGMREDFVRFLGFWLIQGVTVFVVSINSTLFFSSANSTLTWVSWLGLIIFLTGLSIEAVADYQKYQFSQNPKNKGQWIRSGLWSISRHPNYFGEISVWTGLYIFSFAALCDSARLFSLASPLYIALLIIFVSGIPLLEKSADSRWGKDKGYQAYKTKTPVLIPFIK